MNSPFRRFRARLARAAAPACALFVAAFAYFHVSRGLVWSQYFHPDELPVAKWLGQTHRDGYISDRLYPGGWFVLAGLDTAIRRNGRDLAARWDALRGQDGKVMAVEAESFANDPDRPAFKTADIQAGRNFNAFLFACSALLLFLAALETGCGPLPAALAALLFAVLPFPLEHAHYCETDLGLVFSLCLAGWFAHRAVRRASPGWCVAACATAGFAIACKYTLLPVLVWIPALAAATARRRAAAAKLALVCALAAAAGFLAGTPVLRMDPRLFFATAAGPRALSRAAAGLDEAARQALWREGCFQRAAALAREALRLGPATLAFFAACVPFWFRRGNRRLLAAFPLLAAAFVPFAVFAMPWLRNQELLPLLPGFCLGAAPALAWALASFRRPVPPLRKAAAAALVALSTAAFVQSSAAGDRVLSCFQRRDTRAECQNWLAAGARSGVGVAAERYVEQSLRGTPCAPFSCERTAQTWPAAQSLPDVADGYVRYVMRNASFEGRREPASDAAERTRRFERDCLPLARWSLAPGRGRTLTFAQPDVELWALPDAGAATDAPDIPLCIDRPVFFSPGFRSLYAPDAPAPGVGPVRAVSTVGARHAVHPPVRGEAWAVSRVLDGPKAGTVVWESLFEPRRVPLSAAGTAVAALDAAALGRAARRDVRPKTRVRLRGADDQATVCATQIGSDPAEVARILRRAGDPAAALAFLRGRDGLGTAERVEAFLAARDARQPADPSWADAARAALAAFDAAVAAGGGAVADSARVRGVPLRVLRDFSAVRPDGRHGLPVLGDLPVFLPAGRYRVSAVPGPAGTADEAPVLFRGQEGPATTNADGTRTATVRLSRDGLLRTAVPDADPAGEPVILPDTLAVEWDPLEQLERAAGELRRALAAPQTP